MDEDTLNFEKRVGQYVRVRDHIKAMEEKFKKDVAPFKEMLEKLNNDLLRGLHEVGTNSVNTDAGTAYIKSKVTVTLADPGAFMQFVRDNSAFELLDRKANSTAVQAYLAEHNTLPPGVNYSVFQDVGVRRGKLPQE